MSRFYWPWIVAVAVFLGCFSGRSAVAQPQQNGDEVIVTDQLPELDSVPQQIDLPDNPFRDSPSPQQFQPPNNLFEDRTSQAPQPNRVAATPASQSRSNQPAPQNFKVRLARAPKMLGDFFGRGGSTATAPVFFGRAIHHSTRSGDIHLLDESGPTVLYFNGPTGPLFLTPVVSAPVPDLIEGLTSGSGDFIAIRTTDTVDVFEDVNGVIQPGPDIAGAEVFNVFELANIILPSPGAGDIVGRVRLQDNNSPLPQDRIFFDYNFFNNVPFTAEGVDVNRFSPGMERTFWDGMASFEIRVPMAITLNSRITSDLPSDTSSYEFGNMAFSGKFLLRSTENSALAMGLGISLPTADDLDIGLADGTDLLSIQNQSPHILPYIAYLYAPNNSKFFAQAFLTFDFDTIGSPVYANANGLGLEKIGTWQDQHLITLSLSSGSWLYENNGSRGRLKRIGWSAELHYTSTLNDADSVSAGNFTVGDPDADLSLLNGTIGGHVTVGKTTFTAGYSVPLTSNDRVFDGELRFFANRAF